MIQSFINNIPKYERFPQIYTLFWNPGYPFQNRKSNKENILLYFGTNIKQSLKKCKNVKSPLLGYYIPKVWLVSKQPTSISTAGTHNMARANLNKNEWLVTNTTPQHQRRPRICINWNTPFQTSLHKILKNCFLWSKSYFTTFTFRGTFTK